MKWNLIVITIVLSLVSSCGDTKRTSTDSPTELPEAALTLTIETDKTTYRSADPIIVNIKLKNSGNNDVVIKSRMVPGLLDVTDAYPYRDITFIISNSSGKVVPFAARIEVQPPQKKDFIVLSLDKSVDVQIDISDLYYFQEEYQFGTFSMYMVYYNYYSPPDLSLPWIGKLVSNTVSFSIQP